VLLLYPITDISKRAGYMLENKWATFAPLQRETRIQRIEDTDGESEGFEGQICSRDDGMDERNRGSR